VRTQNLKALITVAQLEAAAREAGLRFALRVDQCVLEPGGTLTFLGKSQPARTSPPGIGREAGTADTGKSHC